jgi:hypothetical protein
MLASGVTVSLDSRGRAWDTVLIERFWRTVKYGEFYLKSTASKSTPKGNWMRAVGFTTSGSHPALSGTRKSPHVA